MIDALGCNSEPAKLSFERERINFEFVEQIGEIDIHTNSQKRDKLLLRHGEKLFITVPSSKKRKNISETQERTQDIEIYKNAKSFLTPKEIKMLLASVAEGDSEPSEENTGKIVVLSEKEIYDLLH